MCFYTVVFQPLFKTFDTQSVYDNGILTVPVKIAIIIANLRKEKDWSQADLVKEINISREMVSKYERAIAIPSMDAAKKIADAFGVSLDYLVGEGINASFDKKDLTALTSYRGD